MAILEKEVWVGLGGKNVTSFESLGYNIPRERNQWGKIRIPRGTKILVKVDDLPNRSNVKVTKVCDDCVTHVLNKSYSMIISLREESDGRDRCQKCAGLYGQRNIKNNAPYERSLEYWAKENNKEYLLDEFSSKNNINPNKVFRASSDKYWWNCPDCKNEYDMKMYERTKGSNCPYCSGYRVNHTNCLWTTHPEVACLLVDEEIGYKITHGCNSTYKFSCKDCSYIKNMKVNTVVRYGLACPRCSDGISYPEKFMMNVLNQLNIDYETQKIFNWSRNIECDNKSLSGNKKYDFYIPSLNCIIETHGGQHYDNKSQFERTLKDERENDKLKEKLAKENGIKYYIVVDCRESGMDYLKGSIFNSNLYNLFDLTIVEWLKCHEFACSSMVKKVANLWNSGVKSGRKIAEILSLERSTISKNYLRQAVELGWCDYDPKESQRNSGLKSSKIKKKKVIQLTIEGEFIKEWESARDVYNTIHICYKKISSVCNGKMQSAGGYKWIFKSDYEDYKSTGKIMFNDKRGKSKEVICLNTLEVFRTPTSAGRIVNRAANNIRANILGKTKSCGVHSETGEPLQWMYKEDYEKYIKEKSQSANLENDLVNT